MGGFGKNAVLSGNLSNTRTIERFATQGELEKRFSELTKTPILRIECGAELFFADFRRYIASDGDAANRSLIGVAPDPADSLALPRAADELRIAMIVGGRPNASIDEVETLGSRYGLTRALMEQQTRTLSGGERMLVALARTEALAPVYEGLVLASPVTWLHPGRRHLVEELCESFESEGKPTYLLLLDGDWPEIDASQPNYDPFEASCAIDWTLTLSDVSLVYPPAKFPNNTSERLIQYWHEPLNLQLVSPTLIQGDNGIGKSSLAMLLSGVIRPVAQPPRIVSSGLSGTSRLMFQDTTRQMFGMSAGDHVQSTFRYDRERRKLTNDAVSRVDDDLRRSMASFKGAIGIVDASGRSSSTFHAKLALGLERIASRPPLLILDEPSWGLSGVLSRRLTRILIEEAFSRGVPVAVISHETAWMNGVYNSCLRLTRSDDGRIEATAHAV